MLFLQGLNEVVQQLTTRNDSQDQLVAELRKYCAIFDPQNYEILSMQIMNNEHPLICLFQLRALENTLLLSSIAFKIA